MNTDLHRHIFPLRKGETPNSVVWAHLYLPGDFDTDDAERLIENIKALALPKDDE